MPKISCYSDFETVYDALLGDRTAPVDVEELNSALLAVMSHIRRLEARIEDLEKGKGG